MNIEVEAGRAEMTHFAGRVGHGADDSRLGGDHGRELLDSHTSENADEQLALKGFFQSRLAEDGVCELGLAAISQDEWPQYEILL